jgi:hypothetical protein
VTTARQNAEGIRRLQERRMADPGSAPDPSRSEEGGTGARARPQLTLVAVSSITNEVCFSKSSRPVNFSVIVLPMQGAG